MAAALGANAAELAVYDSERGGALGGARAEMRDGTLRIEGQWDISRYGTVELSLCPGAEGRSVAGVRFLDGSGEFSADVTFAGSGLQTRTYEIPPYYPEWRKTALAIDAVRFGRRGGLGRWGLDWRIWPTTRWQRWHGGFYFDTVRLLKNTVDQTRVTAVEIRLSGESYADGAHRSEERMSEV